MSVMKLFIICLAAWFLSFCSSEYMEGETQDVPMQLSKKFVEEDEAYHFTVSEDGQMMRLEVRGTMPMNSWKAMEMEVYAADGEYLFTYRDELWSETGTDSDGKWTERKEHAYFDIRFPKQGDYFLFLSDSSQRHTNAHRTNYYFRVVPIRGDKSIFTPMLYIFGGIALLCFIILSYRWEEERKQSTRKHPPSIADMREDSKPSSFVIYLVISILFLWMWLFWLASSNDDDDINYVNYAHGHYNLYVDRSVRQQSLSGADFRSGSSRGGK